MDPVGISLGIPGLVTLLISTAIEGYQIFVTARALDDDFKELQRQFGVQQERLKDWAYATNRHANGSTPENRMDYFLKQHPEKLVLIANTLARIAQVFADMQDMKTTYGISVIEHAASMESASHVKKRLSTRMKDKARSMFHRQKAIQDPDPITPPTNIIPNLQISLPLDEVKELAQTFSSSVSSCGRLKWALSDKDRLRELITALERCNQDLIHLTSRYFSSATQIPLSLAENVSSELHFMVPFPKNEKYVGESQVRMFVEQKRRTQDSVISHVSVALHGLGGVGKTQDVLDFVYSCKKAHSVFWIYCESPTRFDEDYRKLAKLVKIPGYNESDSSQDFRGIVKRWLEAKESGDWILVLDNADNKTDFFPGSTGDNSPGLARYIPKCAKGTIIITTRDYEVARQLAGSGDVLTKKEMSFDDAIALFQRNYPSGAPYENTDCDKLLHELQYLPLAITQVASYLEMNREMITPTQYLAKYRKTKTDQQQLLSKPVYNSFRQDSSVSSAGNAETVLTTFAITFQQIQKQSPLADSILRLIACIGAQGIPLELLAELESQSDEIILGEALAKLRNFSLLQRQKDSAGTTYTLHSLVHLSIQYFLSPEEKVSAMETTARALSHVIPSNGAFENWPLWRLYLPHTTAFLSYCGQEIENINVAAICFSMAEYLLETGRYRESQPLAERSVTIRNRLLGHNHSETLKSMLLQAEVLFQIGMHHECEKLEVEVVALSKQALGDDHPQTLKAKSNLALTLRRRGRLNEAEKIQRNILECRKVILGEDHPETLIAMNDLALTLQENARLDEAEILQRKVLETQLLVLGEQHPGTIAAMNNVTLTLQYKGRLDEAEILQRKALETSITILGEDHPDTLAAISNLSITLWNRGKLDEAETLQRNLLKTYKVLLGDDHPDTLTAMNNLSLTIQDKGKWGEAEILQNKVVELRKVAFGEDHPDTLTAISNLALTLRHNENLDEAEKLQQNVLETRKIVFGEDHPETLIAFGNLALTLRNKGRSDEAETLQRKGLETYKVVLGESHPDTLGAMSNLALSLRDNGRWDEAETLQEKVLEIRKDLLGEDHPDTLKIMHQLAYTYHAKSFVDVAIEMMEEVVSRRSRILGNEDEDTKSSMAFLNKWKSEKED